MFATLLSLTEQIWNFGINVIGPAFIDVVTCGKWY